jgi:hypothetical protein
MVDFDISLMVSFNESFLSKGNKRLAFKSIVSHRADVCLQVMHGFFRTTDSSWTPPESVRTTLQLFNK